MEIFKRTGNDEEKRERRVREGSSVAALPNINAPLTVTPWKRIPNSEYPGMMNATRSTYSSSLASRTYFCMWNSSTMKGQDLWVLKERMCDLKWETKRAARIPWCLSWEDSIQITEVLWVYKRGDWDKLGGHVKGLGELPFFMHHVWKPHLFLGPFVASPCFVNNSKKNMKRPQPASAIRVPRACC